MKKLRIYVDTSVVGGCFDEEFKLESCAFIEMAKAGNFTLLFSDLLATELEAAPAKVQDMFGALPVSCFERIIQSDETLNLKNAYLNAKVVGPLHENDAHHVALATVARADLIVSWNFKHIVHYDKIRGFNAANLREGYAIIDIRSPKEVI